MCRGYHTLWGKNPDDPEGPFCAFRISIRDIREAYKYAPLKAMNLRGASEVLRDPNVIYRGIREYETGERRGYCYCGQPESWHIKDGVVAPFDAKKVFCVYASWEKVIFDWRVDDTERTCKGLRPVDCEGRFEEELWVRTT